MNALAGGGTFATCRRCSRSACRPIVANATSNVALLPGAAASAWGFRDELRPIGGLSRADRWRRSPSSPALAGSALLVATPTRAFDLIVPWLLLIAFAGDRVRRKRAPSWLHARVTIGPRTLLVAQALLGIYGGYFGGGVGLMTTATYGLLAGAVAARAVRAAHADAGGRELRRGLRVRRRRAGALGGVRCRCWRAASSAAGREPVSASGCRAGAVRAWTILVTAATTAVFFWRAYA